mgnify:CR=1 FL=1
MRRRACHLILLLALLAPGGCTDEGPPSFQGYMEAELLLVGPDEAGRLETLAVAEGAAVAAGAPLFTLDSAVYRADLAEALAKLTQARAQLANLQAQQQRPEEIAVLRARRAQAEATRDLAAQELRRQRELFERKVIAKARLDQAEAARREAEAALQQIEREIAAGQLSARAQEVSAAEAAVAAAEAALAQAQVRLERRQVAAPAAGIVQDVLYRPGEMVAAGQPVVALLPPERLKVRFFLPEPLLASVRLGQQVAVTCDGCPPGLRARIGFVSREAEFTPPVIFGPEERAKLVFMVEALPDGAAARLLPGQPVTVRLLPDGEGAS